MKGRTLAGMTSVVACCIAVASACGRDAPAEAPEVPTLDVTSWTSTSELFMEYPPLVSGESVRFAVHLTRLQDFSALNAGKPGIELLPEGGGTPVTLQGAEPSRPGVFRVEGVLPKPGRYRWALVISSPALTDRHDLGTVTVFPDAKTAIADAEQHGDGESDLIAYLKEQQWTNPFATTLVREADVRSAFRVPAVIQPVTGGEALVSAPADGRYVAQTLPSVGDRVVAGQDLGRLAPRLADNSDDRATLQASVAEAQASLEAAQADLARAERLLAERAVPARRVEDARRTATVAEVRLRAAQTRLAQRDEVLGSGGGTAAGNAYILRAPIAGRVAEVYAALGASFDEGDRLFRIVRTDEVELQAQIAPADAPISRRITEVAFEVPGKPEAIPLRHDHVHDAGVLDQATRALPVQIEVDNRNGQLLIGQTGTAVIYTGARERRPVVPKDAVLRDAGRPYVFVQTSGESFSRRFVETAGQDGDVIGIRSGIKAGDRVVIRGAYDIQLASAAKGLPAEGHVH